MSAAAATQSRRARRLGAAGRRARAGDRAASARLRASRALSVALKSPAATASRSRGAASASASPRRRRRAARARCCGQLPAGRGPARADAASRTSSADEQRDASVPTRSRRGHVGQQSGGALRRTRRSRARGSERVVAAPAPGTVASSVSVSPGRAAVTYRAPGAASSRRDLAYTCRELAVEHAPWYAPPVSLGELAERRGRELALSMPIG